MGFGLVIVALKWTNHVKLGGRIYSVFSGQPQTHRPPTLRNDTIDPTFRSPNSFLSRHHLITARDRPKPASAAATPARRPAPPTPPARRRRPASDSATGAGCRRMPDHRVGELADLTAGVVQRIVDVAAARSRDRPSPRHRPSAPKHPGPQELYPDRAQRPTSAARTPRSGSLAPTLAHGPQRPICRNCPGRSDSALSVSGTSKRRRRLDAEVLQRLLERTVGQHRRQVHHPAPRRIGLLHRVGEHPAVRDPVDRRELTGERRTAACNRSPPR